MMAMYTQDKRVLKISILEQFESYQVKGSTQSKQPDKKMDSKNLCKNAALVRCTRTQLCWSRPRNGKYHISQTNTRGEKNWYKKKANFVVVGEWIL